MNDNAGIHRRWRLSAAVVLLLGALFSSAVFAGGENAADAAIKQVINHQLAAFSDDDAQRAFSYASPGIRRGFASAEAFLSLVHQRYPAVYEASTVRFRERVSHPGFEVQRVQFIGPQGGYWNALYRMEQLQDGQWRIGGVVLKPISGGI